MNSRNPETIVNRGRKFVQNTALALTLGGATAAMTAPAVEARDITPDLTSTLMKAPSADCVGFTFPKSGPIEGRMRVNASRRFMLNGENVSQSLNGSPEVFNSVDEAGNTMEEVSVGRPTIYDIAFTGPDGSKKISRSRFPQGAMETSSYWIQRDSEGEMQNVGEVMTFTSPDTGERYEVTNSCGVKEERRGFTLQASLMFRRGEVLLQNGWKRIVELCLTNDHWTHTAQLQRPSKQSEAPVVVPPTPVVPTPEERPDFPAQYPAQYTPYNK